MQGIQDVTIQRGESFSLECKFTGQPGIVAVWYRNDQYMSRMDNRVNTKNSINGTELTTVLSFTRIKSEEDFVAFSCLAWYPKLNPVHAQSTSTIHVTGRIVAVVS